MDHIDIQKLIQSGALDSRDNFRQSSIRLLAETNERMLAEGVPVQIVAAMSARIMSRILRPSASEIARKMFPIQELPQGAVLYYGSEPEKK